MKITIEQDGQKLVVDGPWSLSVKSDVVEVPCDCDVDCGYIHRKLLNPCRIEASVDLPSRPLWEQVT